MVNDKRDKFDYEKNIMGLYKVDYLVAKSYHKFKMQMFLQSTKELAGRFLEIGCGAGVFSYNVSKYCPSFKIIAFDISRSAIKEAKLTINQPIKWLVADGECLPFQNNKFAVIALMDIVEHMPDISLLFKECYRVIQNGGVLHGNIPCENNKYTIWWLMEKLKIGNKLTQKHLGHIQKLTTEELILALKQAGFEIKSIYYSRHLFGQLVTVFGFCIPKEILVRLFGPNVSLGFTDYAINNKNNPIQHKPFTVRILILFQRIWYGLLRFLDIISYYEILVLKRYRFMATDVHVTCVKRSVLYE
ncbi:MAG: class I SAM-dependent methyltransferase [bacterium]